MPEQHYAAPYTWLLLAHVERRPWPGDHVLQYRGLPGILRVRLEEGPGIEVLTAGMPRARHKAHLGRHVAVC